MLSFFRRFTQSKVGVIVTFAVLGIIALAFAAGDITGLRPAGGGIGGDNVAEVGGRKIGAAELREAVQRDIEVARQRQPTIDAAGYVAQGGFEATLERLLTTTALRQFAEEQGMAVSRRYVDGQIASIPSLQGPTGKFDQTLYERILAQRRLTDAQVRDDLIRDTLVQLLVVPTIGAAQMPRQLALPYASLLLERRRGLVGFVPRTAVPAGAALSDAEVTAFYNRHRQRYAVPERRVARYARVTPEFVRAQASPTDAEIARAYAADRARYAPTERRTVAQVIVASQATANALAQRVRGGTGLAAAAAAVGLEASTQAGVTRAAYAGQTSEQVAAAVFAAPQGGVVGPVRGALGFVVARIEGVEQVPGRTLAEARGEIAAALSASKTAEALGRLQDTINDAAADGATFDEIVAERKLAAAQTAAVTAAGLDPLAANPVADPALAPIVAAAYAAEEGDAPQIVPLGQDGGFALVAVGRALPAAPRPLGEIRARVTADAVADRARQAARGIAGDVLAKVNRGVALADALRQTGLPLPAPRPLDVPRSALATPGRPVEPTLALLFSMSQGTAKLLEAPNNAGWLVVRLDAITPGDARNRPQVVDAARADLARLVGREYVDQFARAVRDQVGVRRDDAAIARVRAELAGRAAPAN